MYRFRTIESLLDKYNELENQEIYFASPEELNDPIEGYKDLFWKGDAIVWKNLILSYIRSFEHAFALSVLLNEEKAIDENDIVVSYGFRNHNSVGNRELLQEICDRAFKIDYIAQLPESLANRKSPIRRSELLSYLHMVHPFVVNTISTIYFERKFTTRPLLMQDITGLDEFLKMQKDLPMLTNQMEEEHQIDVNYIDKFFLFTSMTSQQFSLMHKLKLSENELSSNTFFLLSEFTEKYISKIESLLYPEWFSASFLKECNNSSVWGHYGQNHTGVCLKFRTLEVDETYKMNLNDEHLSVLQENMKTRVSFLQNTV